MQSPEDNHNHNHNHHHRHSDAELPGGDEMSSIGPLSGPLNKSGGGKKNARFSLRDDNTTAANDCVEITDPAVVHKAGGGGAVELTLPAKGLEKKSSLVSNALSRIRQVLQELRRCRFLTRRPQPAEGRLDRSKSAAAHALKGLKFISETEGDAAWSMVENRFRDLTATTNGLLPRSLFGECIGMYKKSDKQPDKESGKKFADKLFVALARERNITGDCITKAQLEEFWSQITNQSSDCRLQAFFDMVDENGDGRITKDEVKEILSLSASANKLSNIQKQADEYAALLVEVLDRDKDGYITIEELKMLLLQDTNQSGRSDGESRNLISKMLSENLTPTQEHPLKKWYKDFQHFFDDHWRRVWVMALWIGVMAGLFAYKYVQYRNRAVFDVMGHCVCMAKGAAETLKLNMALILLPMCRNTITWLRNKTRLGMVVPFDDNINFHKVIAAAVAIGIGIHGISHLACDFPRLLDASPEKYKPMEQFFGDQPTRYWHFMKGWEGVTGILMVVLMAIAFTLAFSWFRTHKMKLPKPLDKVKSLEPLNKRLEKMKLPEPLKKLTGFNAFWYSHHLFIIVYALLIIHGTKLYLTHEWYKKTTWMYLAIPITLYAGERLIRAFRSSFKDVKTLKVTIYSGNVLALQMSKPQNFRYESGEYIFVNCAAVSPFEWHPFSITSAPGDDHLSVHIKRAGDWTEQLIDDFSKFCQPPPSGDSGILVAQGENIPSSLKVHIDGPYGAPTQDYKDYDVVLLVGLGIGATPMISVVKDIINNVKDIEEKENALEEGLARPSSTPKQRRGCGSGQDNFKTRKAYFYWMTREQGSFDWFKGLMNEVAEIDHRGVIEMHNYCTSVYKKGDFRSALIAMLQTINLAKEGVDIVSGTRIKTDFGRPDWRKVYEEIEANHPNSRVGVFYCGASRELVNDLKQLASDFSRKTTTTTTKFEFHKENF